ncbi:voltage-dependent L-type calcium channel subunit alpha-1D-like [Paramacrobiotus metropolitanus]|uniref:voltage-dependent L-type calcium channel subunit alpha-1D-like n=1 Tax=Paramacrobiotus metropolitanus TaxID=2943436 RepID=UPI00244611B8|nr:voltage-dependent L-type calcium channel subunit alpha-1D-like [Paramacrobiotus metropolitanus]
MPSKTLPRSLFCLPADHPVRRAALWIVRWKPFDVMILCLILANCIALAIHRSYPNGDSDKTNDILDKLEYFFIAVFTLECALKITAFGFIGHPGAYMRNGLNVLDFIIVVVGLISVAIHASVPVADHSATFDVNALRAFRVLRPLRLVSGLPSLQVVLNAVLQAMLPLLHIALLVLFMMLTYAIVGVELFMGILHRTCFTNRTGEFRIVKNPETCATDEFCDVANGEHCLPGWEGPEHGITSFDNIGLAMLTVFQCLTLEGWSSILYAVENIVGQNWAWIYFVSLVILGSYFLLNLILGVLSGMFSKEKQKAEKSGALKKFMSGRNLDSFMQDYLQRIASRRNRPHNRPRPINEDIRMLRHDIFVVGWRDTMTFCQIQKGWQRARISCFRLIKSRFFFWLIIVLVFLNTCVLATEYYGQPHWLTVFQDRANVVFVILFLGELFIRMFALGTKHYFASFLNRFEFVIIGCSVIECVLNQLELLPELGLSVLRAARLVRIFQITQHWSSLRSVTFSIVNSLKSIISLLFLLFLFLFVFAILGMQLFGGKFIRWSEDDDFRPSFDSFWQAGLSVFQMLTGEDWHKVMFRGIQAYNGIHSVGAVMSLYFVAVIVGGRYILLNVFLAIAVDNMSEATNLSVEDIPGEITEIKETNIHYAVDDPPENVEEVQILLTEREQPSEQLVVRDRQCWSSPCRSTRIMVKEAQPVHMRSADVIHIQSSGNLPALPVPPVDYMKKAQSEETVEEEQEMLKKQEHQSVFASDPLPLHRSLFLFGSKHPLRKWCYLIATDRVCRSFILVCIILSSALLAAVDPVSATPTEFELVISYLDYFFTGLFTIELGMKIVAYGFILHPGSFCRSWFNILDLLVVILSLVSYAFDDSEFSSIKTLRVFRVFRPLIAVNRAEGLRRIIHCVTVALRSIWNVVLVIVVTMIMFAIMGVQIFKGRFYRCSDLSKHTEHECRGNFVPFVNGYPADDVVEREWIDNEFNFDNIFQAFLTLVAVVTTEGWPKFSSYAYVGVDSNAEGHGPIFNYRPYTALYFVTYLSVVGFFMMNIFIGFIIITFLQEGEQEYADCQLDENQRRCMEFALTSKPIPKYIPQRRLQYKIWWLVGCEHFENCIFGLIFLNTIAMSVRYDGQPKGQILALEYLNMTFTAVFVLECVLKLFAFNIIHYFKDVWNVFDFVVVFISMFDIGYSLYTGTVTEVNIFRIFRVLRLGKLLGKSRNTRILFWTFLKSMRALPYVILLIGVIYFIYAVIGMHVFGRISLINKDSSIDRHNHFQNFPRALLLLFRSATGEGWQDIMMSCANRQDVFCDARTGLPAGSLCGSDFSYVYFTSFHFLCSFMILNVLVAIIMDNFDYLTRDWSVVGPQHLDEFVRLWSEYDPLATGYIKHMDVISLLRSIDPPLGIGRLCPRRIARKRLLAMNMPLNSDGTVQYNATLFALIRTALHIYTEGSIDETNAKLREVVLQIWRKTSEYKLDTILPKPGADTMTVGTLYAATIMQDYYRRYRKRKCATSACATAELEDDRRKMEGVLSTWDRKAGA